MCTMKIKQKIKVYTTDLIHIEKNQEGKKQFIDFAILLIIPL